MDVIPPTPPCTILPSQSVPLDVAMAEPELQPEINASLFVPATPPPSCAALPHSTPVKIETSTTIPFTTNQKYRIDSRTVMGSEIKKYLVGPMPAQQFLDDFFPVHKLSKLKVPNKVPKFKSNCYSKTIKAKKEKNAYNPFVSLFDKSGYASSQVLFEDQYNCTICS